MSRKPGNKGATLGRVFLKLYSIIAIAVLIYVIGASNLSTILHGTLERYYGSLSRGTIYLIEKQLADLPPQQWPALLDTLNRGGGYPMRILPIDSLEFPDAMMERINQGVLVSSEVHGADYAYRRILNSKWVLEFPLEQSEYDDDRRLSNSTFNLIEMTLQAQPQSRWHSIVAELDKQFSFPVILLKMKNAESDISSSQQGVLKNGEVAQKEIGSDTQFLYRRIGSTAYVARIGPFQEPLTLDYLEFILLLVFALLVALALLFWLYPLWRDLKQLRVSASAFGQGDFNIRSPLSRRSVLYQLAESFNGMADRIQGLISSHKELTNAVSHELRTPIARLRFGMEMLQSSTDEAARKRFMKSMNTDIDELDQLVAELLTYARFDRDKPTLKFQRQEIEPWLTDIIRQSQTGRDRLSITYEIAGNKLKYARFEPKLLARAVGNLLQNARRYAQTRINVIFTCDDGLFQITIDDDGPGIPKHQRESIFEAFKRLDASRGRNTGGYGLGLSIAQRISRWHDGNISVQDSPLGGARFIIRWPENEHSPADG